MNWFLSTWKRFAVASMAATLRGARWSWVVAFGLWSASAAQTDPFGSEIRPKLEEFCFKCHGASRPKAGVNLSGFTNSTSIYRDIRLWQKVASQLREGAMPPEGKPQPPPEHREAIVRFVENTLRDLDEGHIPKDPGRVVIHRLSRTEYNCTIRDLFGVTSNPADKFPADGGGGGGFDNNADTLFIPPILMERYLEAATSIIDEAPREKIFFEHPTWFRSEKSAARKILQHFATRTYRRPLEKAELEALNGLYDNARRGGQAHETAVKRVLSALLVSPNFLFRVERDPISPVAGRINDYELASRLSYFLWSSLPDDELFAVAKENRLHEPKVIEQQVRRMILDPKSKVFTENFAAQWLRVRELNTSAQPDPRKFKEYTPALRDAMYTEVVEFFDAVLREDRPILDILSSDYTFVNGDLARHYGWEGVTNQAFQRIALTNATRGGVVGMAGILTLTSYPLRTSPVLRGKWILEEILGTPPPPPPPLVKSLPQDDSPRQGLTFRQRLEQHREKPECVSCHKRMDPLGFGLENFDAIGRWRTAIGGEPVDAKGVLPGDEKFEGPAELKQVLLAHKPDFVRNLTEKMLAYALGRGLEYYDIPTVKEISKKLDQQGYRSSVLIVEIAKSYPFQFRRGDPKLTSK